MAMNEDERGAAMVAVARLAVLEDMLWRLRQEVLPTRMIAAALGALAAALGAEGAAIVAVGPGADAPVRHLVGAPPEPLPAAILTADGAAHAGAAAGRQYLACPCWTRFRPPEALLLWRAERAPPWPADACGVLVAAAGLLRLVLEQEAIQVEMASQTRADPLTGLADRRGFGDEMARRIDRLEREGLPGALLLIDVDALGAFNARAGLEAGDAVLIALAALLRTTFRPTDLLARMGGDEFAVWLDGADELATAERAEALRAAAAVGLAALTVDAGPMPSLSMGIGTRWPGEGEEAETLLARVDAVLQEVKRSAPGTWRVSQG
jgi:diguanylate cyclase (GGDEF)-like protein